MKTSGITSFILSSALFFSSSCSNSRDDPEAIVKRIRSDVENIDVNVNNISEYYGGARKKHSNAYSDVDTLCSKDEYDYQLLRNSLLIPLQKSVYKKDLSSLNRIPFLNFKNGDKKKVDQFTFIDWSFEEENTSLSESSLGKFISSLGEIEYFRISPFQYTSFLADRDKNLAMEKLTLLSYFDLRSKKGDELRHDRGRIEMIIEKVKGEWKVIATKPIVFNTLTGSRPNFKKLPPLAKNNLEEFKREESIIRAGFGTAVSDIDNDGLTDLIISSKRNINFFFGIGKEKFQKVNGVVPDNVDLVKHIHVQDIDGDNDKDILFQRFVLHHFKESLEDSNNENEIFSQFLLYERTGNKFVKKNKFLNSSLSFNNFYMSHVADFNNDGLNDLFLGFPGSLNRESKNRKEMYLRSDFIGLHQNNGTSFSQVAQKEANSEKEEIYNNNSLVLDVDGDNRLDYVGLTGKKSLISFYKNFEDGKFYELQKNSGNLNTALPFAIDSGHVDNDTNRDFIIANVNFLAGERFYNSCSRNWKSDIRPYANNALELFEFKNDNFHQKDLNLDFWTGEGVNNVKLIDYDLDGDLDIYVTNGLWSADSNEKDLSSLFIQAVNSTIYHLYYELAEDGPASDFMNILIGYKDALFKGQRKGAFHLAGHQRNRLYKNVDGQFIEVAYLEGIDSIADGYSINTGDLNNDGKLDLVLRNAENTPTSNYEALEIFLNQSQKNSLTLELIPEKNMTLIGTVVKVTTNDKQEMIKQIMSDRFNNHNQKILSFGIGSRSSVKKIEVQWRDGTKSVYQNVSKGSFSVRKSLGLKKVN